MIKPSKLNRGDKIATISLSWGGAGELLPRYYAGKSQLMEAFDVEVIESKHALKSAEWIYKNPQARADDLMEVFENRSIKAIISNVGGEDSLRTIKYVDFNCIKNNPKIFLGFSDSTVTHFCCYKAGLTSFYGTSIMVGFAENCGIHPYQISDVKQTLFNNSPRGEIMPNFHGWTSEKLDWSIKENQLSKRKLITSTGWRFLQGDNIAEGELLGGCIQVLEFIKDTIIWVKPKDWLGKILFLETSEEELLPHQFRWILRNYAASGILKNICGLIVGRPYGNIFWKEYDEIILQVCEEENLKDLPIITGMDFGHTSPVFTLPIGCLGRIDPANKKFSILESGVI